MGDKLLFLLSSKGDNNIFNLDKRIVGSYKLLSFICTNNIYNITDRNNKVYWNDNGTDRETTLTNGYYDESDFTSMLSSKLNDVASGGMTISLDNNTRKLTITSTNNFYFSFGSNTSNSGRKLLGFNEEDGSNNTSQTSDIPIELNTNKTLFISIGEDDNKDIEGIDFFNASLVINDVIVFGECLRYINNNNFEQYIRFRKPTNKISISFHDDENNTINLNSEYHIILQKV